jgi:hypothetical protein
LQQQLAGGLSLPGRARIEAAQYRAGAAQALLQQVPRLLVPRVLAQPMLKARGQGGVVVACVELHHPVDGLFADAVEHLAAHGCSSHR